MENYGILIVLITGGGDADQVKDFLINKYECDKQGIQTLN